jgi:hypothetical protein
MENIFPTLQANFGPRAIAHQTTGRTRLLGQQALVVHGQPNRPDLATRGGGWSRWRHVAVDHRNPVPSCCVEQLALAVGSRR